MGSPQASNAPGPADFCWPKARIAKLHLGSAPGASSTCLCTHTCSQVWTLPPQMGSGHLGLPDALRWLKGIQCQLALAFIAQGLPQPHLPLALPMCRWESCPPLCYEGPVCR